MQMVDIQTLLEAFMNLSLWSAFFIDETLFLVKSKISSFRLLSSNARLLDDGLKEFAVYTLAVLYVP